MKNNKVSISSLPGRTITLEKEEYLFFSGTAYLGIGHQASFRSAFYEGVEKYGTIYSASRHNNGQLDIYDEAENYLARVNNAEAAVTISSGLLAGQLVMKMLEGSKVIYAPGVHPALWEHAGIHPEFIDSTDFNTGIAEHVAVQTGKVIICANTIDPLRCKPISFEWVEYLPGNTDITLIFDDSHAMGVLPHSNGQVSSLHGKSSYAYLRSIIPDNVKLIVISSMAKASGIPGGLILSDAKTIHALKSMPLFAGASPVVPAYLYAFLHSKKLYDKAHGDLMQNIRLFTTLNEEFLNNFIYLHDYPVFHTTRNELYSLLLNEKIMISSFAYPDPDAPPITRIVISALHTEDDIKALSESLKRII